MKNLLLILAIGFALFHFFSAELESSQASDAAVVPIDEGALTAAFQNRLSDVQVGGSGQVVKLLPDDTQGSRHQKFILRLASDNTVLVAHNIDLAPRIDTLREGDTVAFYGEYEWNSRGGVLHWTHRDPGGRHEHGWLKHQGVTYQ